MVILLFANSAVFYINPPILPSIINGQMDWRAAKRVKNMFYTRVFIHLIKQMESLFALFSTQPAPTQPNWQIVQSEVMKLQRKENLANGILFENNPNKKSFPSSSSSSLAVGCQTSSGSASFMFLLSGGLLKKWIVNLESNGWDQCESLLFYSEWFTRREKQNFLFNYWWWWWFRPWRLLHRHDIFPNETTTRLNCKFSSGSWHVLS